MQSQHSYHIFDAKKFILSIALIISGIILTSPLLHHEYAYADKVSLVFPSNNPDDPNYDATLMEGLNPSNDTSTVSGVGMNYREYAFMVNYSELKSNTEYHISVSGDDGYLGQLINSSIPVYRINGVGNNVKPGEKGEGFGKNTWGYAITPVTNFTDEVNLDDIAYSSVEIASSQPAASTFTTNKQPDNTGSDKYRLTFASRFGEGYAMGHYESKVYVSVAMEPSKAVTLSDISTMQEMSSDICRDTPPVTATDTNVPQYQLRDTRDDKIYYVAKLADGNCWMTQNLAYNGGGIARIYDGKTTCGGWTDDGNLAQYCAISHADGNHSSRGNHYSWPAARNGDTSTYGPIQGICPNGTGKNWQLPISNTTTTSGSFGKLTTTYSINNDADGLAALRAAPFYFITGGGVNSAGISGIGGGFYWSSTPGSYGCAYLLYLGAYSADPSYGNYSRYFGYFVRCVFVPN